MLHAPPAAPAETSDGFARALLNILEDFSAEKQGQSDTQRAMLNLLEDFGAEKDRLESTQRAVLNILEDFAGEKQRLEAAQKAVLNILEDFEEAKTRVEEANDELRREVAERRQAEEELREKTEALARSNADLEQFAYVASHDLQEPLRMVSSYMQLLSRRYEGRLDEQADRYIRYAVEGAHRMQALIGGLLEYSRVDRRAQPARVSARAAFDQALANLAEALRETGARVTREPLPDVICDGDQLARVFQNLVGNALKFRRPGTAPRVHASARRDGRFWQLSVRDEGIGLEPKFAERIFVIFQRLHTRDEYPGTGIGLSICRKVVERHGGRIWVESEPGRGADFRFTLPAGEGGE